MTASSGRDWGRSFRGAIALFVLGMLGVVALAIYSVPALRSIPELADFPYPALVLVAALNSTVLLLVFVFVGTVAAPRIGLTSHVYDWATGTGADWQALRGSIPFALAIGAGTFVLAAILETLFAPFVAVDPEAVVPTGDPLRTLAESMPMRLLYGGITEELLLRWGVMAPIAWAIWRVRGRLGRTRVAPASSTMWLAIFLSAVLFGLGHLPGLAATTALTLPLVAQIVVLNAVVGIALGWLFWRYSLETAMVAHAAFHVALFVVSAVLILLV